MKHLVITLRSSSMSCRHIYQHFRIEKSMSRIIHVTCKPFLSQLSSYQWRHHHRTHQEKKNFSLCCFEKYHWQSVALPDIDLKRNWSIIFGVLSKETKRQRKWTLTYHEKFLHFNISIQNFECEIDNPESRIMYTKMIYKQTKTQSETKFEGQIFTKPCFLS